MSMASRIRDELHRRLDGEIENTVQVAICMAAGMSRRDIKTTLGLDDIEVRMCEARLTAIAAGWRNE
jgi:hypothetical protein